LSQYSTGKTGKVLGEEEMAPAGDSVPDMPLAALLGDADEDEAEKAKHDGVF
jgi:hypothetical protein